MSRGTARGGAAPFRRERGSISADEIVSGAFRLVREISVEGLSMPKLAQELGIGVTSIYWYFKSKDELLEALTAEAVRQFHAQLHIGGDAPWPEQLRAMFHKVRAVMRSDDVLCDLLFMRNSRFSAEALHHIWPQIEGMLQLMVDAGFTPQEAVRDYFALAHYTRGCIVLERQMLKADLPAVTPVRLPASFDTHDFPLLSQASRWHSLRGTRDSEYDAGLQSILDGMQARLALRHG